MAKSANHKIAKSLNHGIAERMLYFMKLARMAEERIERVLYRQGKIVGGVYVGRGQEAVGVATAIQLVEGDVILPNHRDFAAFVIRGFELPEIFANWMGRIGGPTRGRDNTLHLGDMQRGVIPIISHLGDTCPVACGVAMVLKRRGKGNVALVTFGEGTTSRGDVHEAMNMASVMKLPVIFVCNNNGYAYSTHTAKQYAVKDLSVRGSAYNMPGVTVDGTDVLAIHAAAARAIARARAGQGPSFIECKTYRMTGHSAHDMAEYVPEKILKEGEKKDPVARLQTNLLRKRLMTRQGIHDLEEKIRKEIDAAVASAEASPMPEGASALEGVYCGDDCWWKKKSVDLGRSSVATDN
ncbi:MAG TPA: thiamine pyrophosphate-dependent dehydrogenase E1 component subunit alpha [Terriglobia bacterium]|nr:thiamine pyrophosphate-dependent dehydrogenase E1 component subunit alpha [Terriglobia bacterium]